MNITGIIAEYNIFHNGHKYQIDEIKKHSDAVIAVMSGSFVQRGDVAITDKWSRAKTALSGGVAGLVLPLSRMSCNQDAEPDRIVLGEGISFVDRESL